MERPTSKKAPIPLGYKHDGPKKHLSSNMKALGPLIGGLDIL